MNYQGTERYISNDSLNAAVLAPDVDASSETYGNFLSNVALDMTQKAGQKCTATRRILVPADRVDEVKADLAAEIARQPLGDPSVQGTRLGPVAHEGQLADVRYGNLFNGSLISLLKRGHNLLCHAKLVRVCFECTAIGGDAKTRIRG